MNTQYFKNKIATISICIFAMTAGLSHKSGAAYYDLYWDNYMYYNAIAESSLNWSDWNTYYYAYALPYYCYYLGGYNGDLYGYYDGNGYKQFGWGDYYYDLYNYYGDWYWNNY